MVDLEKIRVWERAAIGFHKEARRVRELWLGLSREEQDRVLNKARIGLVVSNKGEQDV